MKRTKEVELEDGSKATYSLKGLTEDDIVPWTQFCASVFAYKANPPPAAYFQRHYVNDPDRDASLIRVAVVHAGDEEQIVASVRVFVRRIGLANGDGRSCLVGGIGEVCTHDDHRRRGLSKWLLQDAIAIMKEYVHTSKQQQQQQLCMQYSLLHAAPAFFPVYQKSGGYQGTTTKWSVVNVTRNDSWSLPSGDTTDAQANGGVGLQIRPAKFPTDTLRLSALHKLYSEDRFVGCIIRSQSYWNDYLSKELEGSLWVLVDSERRTGEDGDGAIVGWWSFRPRGDRYQLREFGVDQQQSKARTVLTHAAQHMLKCNNMTDGVLALPTVVLDDAFLADASETNEAGIDLSSRVSEDDLGWMYTTLQEDCEMSIHDYLGDGKHHLIWPADSF